eukprot:1144610_1
MSAKAASVFVEAEGDDSDEEGHSIAVDVWLSVNRITNVDAVQKKFAEREITIEELLEFTEQDLRSFCKELQFDTLTTTRLIHGVRNTLKESSMAAPAAPANPTDTSHITIKDDAFNISPIQYADGDVMPVIPPRNAEPAMNDNNNIQHVIVSPQEHEAMEQMYKRYDMASTLSETIQKSYGILNQSKESAKADLNEKFTLLFEQMKLRQEELNSMIDELGKHKEDTLKQQNEQLTTYKTQISAGKKEYENLISDVNIDIHKRKIEIMSMINNIMNSKVPLSLITQPEIKFAMPPKAVQTFLGALAVDNCDRPSPPVLILGKVSFDTMIVSWQTEFDQDMAVMSNRKSVEYQLCFAKFIKEFIMSKKDRKKGKKKEQKKNKKSQKNKKRKRKKKKHRKYDSDSSSDSDSTSSDTDTSSTSDSDSDTTSSSSSSASSSGVDMDEITRQNEDEKSPGINEGVGDDDNRFKNIDLSVLNWKRIRLNGKAKSHRIKGLVHGWSYLVRIRGKNDSGWGEYSDPIKVSTKSINLIWNQHKHGKGVTFVSKNRCKFSSKQAKIVVDYKVKSKTHKIFSWEFKLDRVSNYAWIGFVRGPARQYANWHSCLGANNNMNEYSIGFGSGSKSLCIQNKGGYNHGHSIPLTKSIRNHDRFRFKANMKNKTVTVYHNGKNVGRLFQNIPNCIVPAASNNSSHLDISVRFAS